MFWWILVFCIIVFLAWFCFSESKSARSIRSSVGDIADDAFDSFDCDID